ncbi:hypothetical protein STRTUCAR8_08244, partial [Streptomyces turgidiscabies Car8]
MSGRGLVHHRTSRGCRGRLGSRRARIFVLSSSDDIPLTVMGR